MKIGIMQPYFFPYIGYFQLIAAVDTLIVYDDVHYINGGWINRNFIWSHSGPQRITLPLRGRSQNLLINEIQLLESPPDKLIKTLTQTYSKAPQFHSVMPLLIEALTHQETRLDLFLFNALRVICNYLGIQTRFLESSTLHLARGLKGQERVICLCKDLGASSYINLPGGISLYDSELFQAEHLQLHFLAPRNIHYPQFGQKFLPNLSFIDVLMFNERSRCNQLLTEFDLQPPLISTTQITYE